METLAQQLERVQEAIAEIVSGAQSASSEGESLTRPSLETLRDIRRDLRNEIARGDRGNISVAET